MNGFVRVGSGSWEVTDLRGDHEVLRAKAEPLQHAREHPFRATVAIHIRVVEVVDALIDGHLDGGGDFVFIDVRPAVREAVNPVQPAHGPAAEATKRSIVHPRPPS
jgi:hypothetical protein